MARTSGGRGRPCQCRCGRDEQLRLRTSQDLGGGLVGRDDDSVVGTHHQANVASTQPIAGGDVDEIAAGLVDDDPLATDLVDDGVAELEVRPVLGGKFGLEHVVASFEFIVLATTLTHVRDSGLIH